MNLVLLILFVALAGGRLYTAGDPGNAGGFGTGLPESFSISR